MLAQPAEPVAVRDRLTSTTDEFAKAHLHDHLRWVREALVWRLGGLSEYDIRRLLTATGTNLLGLVKHNAIWVSRYFGEVFGRPFAEPLPRWDDRAARGTHHWATAAETRDGIVDLYRRVGEHVDAAIVALSVDSPGFVPRWDERAPLQRHGARSARGNLSCGRAIGGEAPATPRTPQNAPDRSAAPQPLQSNSRGVRGSARGTTQTRDGRAIDSIAPAVIGLDHAVSGTTQNGVVVGAVDPPAGSTVTATAVSPTCTEVSTAAKEPSACFVMTPSDVGVEPFNSHNW